MCRELKNVLFAKSNSPASVTSLGQIANKGDKKRNIPTRLCFLTFLQLRNDTPSFVQLEFPSASADNMNDKALKETYQTFVRHIVFDCTCMSYPYPLLKKPNIICLK